VRRRKFAISVAAASAWPIAVLAQEARKPRSVGVMSQPGFHFDALKDGLRALGYRDGIDITLHYPPATASVERLAANAESLVRLGVEVIVAGGSESVEAARNATSSIPIVMTLVGDPVELGFAQSLARPGGNITGLSNLSLDLAGKWIELLKEVDPRIRRIAVLWNPPHPAHRKWVARIEEAAASSGVQLAPLAVETPEEIERMIIAAGQAQVTGIIVPGSSLHTLNFGRIADFAARGRIASIGWTGAFTVAGGLIAYGASEAAQFRRAAIYVDKILKGAKPVDLPIEQPTRFELALNLRTAKALGLAIPPSILVRADEVIE